MKPLLPSLALGLLLAAAPSLPGTASASAKVVVSPAGPAAASMSRSTATAPPSPDTAARRDATAAITPSAVHPETRPAIPARCFCTGRIEGSSGARAPFATIVLMRDGRQVAGTTADTLGVFSLYALPGSYTASIRHLSYRPLRQPVTISPDSTVAPQNPGTFTCNLGTFRLLETSTTLEGVTIEAAAVRREADRFVLTVGDALSLAGKDATELLAQAPGVWLDDSGVSINGSKGVKVFIDDRELRLDGDRLTTYLHNLTAAEIARIEVIPQAGAEYAADARGGVLRIFLRRRHTSGMNGSLGMATRQGAGVSSYLPSAHLSLNSGKWTVSAAGSGLFMPRGNTHYEESRTAHSDAMHFAGRSDLDYRNNYGSGRLSAFFDPSEHHSLGGEAEYSAESRSIPSSAHTELGQPEAPSATASRYLQSGTGHTLSATFNYVWRIDTLGSGLKAIIDCTRRRTSDANSYRTSSTFGQLRHDTIYRSTAASRYDILSVETALDLHFPHSLKLQAGLKYTRNRLTDDTRYEGHTAGWETRPVYCYTLGYTEQIAAAYASLAAELGNWSLSAGIRAEYAATEGRNGGIRRNRFDLFPHASATVAFDRLRLWMLAAQYSRNIDRPGFRALNPARIQFSDYNYQIGNPALRPTYIHRVSLTLIWKYRYTLTVGGNLHRDLIREVGKTDPDDPEVTYITPENHPTENHWFAALSAPIKLTRRWRLAFNVVGVRQQLRLNASDPLAGHWLLFANATTEVELPANFHAELTYQGHTRLYSGNSEVEGRHTLAVSLKKRLCRDRLTLSVSVVNLTGAREAYVSHIDGVIRRMEGLSAWNARQCKVALSWNFRTGRDFRNRKIEAASGSERLRMGKSDGQSK